MSAKTNADVIIGGKVYTLSGYESEAYLQQIAAYMNNKIGEFDELEDYRRFPGDMKATLLELNIADDYFKAKQQAEKLQEDLEAQGKELYDMKHELVSSQIKLENLEKSLEDAEKENKELLLNKTKLETALEDALLGKVESGKQQHNKGKDAAGKR
jgi:cell division protein ZapA